MPAHPVRVTCVRCEGKKRAIVNDKRCPTCGGEGWLYKFFGGEKTCGRCDGDGRIYFESTCPECRGRGYSIEMQSD